MDRNGELHEQIDGLLLQRGELTFFFTPGPVQVSASPSADDASPTLVPPTASTRPILSNGSRPSTTPP